MAKAKHGKSQKYDHRLLKTEQSLSTGSYNARLLSKCLYVIHCIFKADISIAIKYHKIFAPQLLQF